MTANKTRRRLDEPWHVPTAAAPAGPSIETAAQQFAESSVALQRAVEDRRRAANETLNRSASVSSRRGMSVGTGTHGHFDFDDFVSTQPSESFDIDPEDTITITGTAPPALRRSIADEPLAPISGLLAKAEQQQLRFTGTGSEYFRIWVINTLLTLLTLGLYSPWAKRRKLRWFARHTFLDGEAFDFHGDPRRILVGRVLALGLVVGYTHAFQWSLWAGWGMLAVLYLFGPALFAGAQRFRLGNTSWRGVRFGFHAGASVVYASCLPLVVAWTVTSVGVAAGMAPWLVGLATLAVVMGFPIAHGWLKRFQHQHAVYGTLPFRFDFSVRGFYGLYLALVGLVAAVSIGSGVASFAVLGMLGASGVGVDPRLISALVAVGSAVLMLVLAWPTYMARLQRLVWSNTRLAGGIEFRYELQAGTLAKVLATHGLLVPLTLGLYWPFVAVRLARLRIEALTVLADEPLGEMVVPARGERGAHASGKRGAVGDAAADAFGLDLGW